MITSNNLNKSKGGESPKQRLTKEEEAEYRAADKCFNCGGNGHFSCNCPQGKTMKSLTSKPPGLRSFSVHVPTEDSTWGTELKDTTEGLRVAMASFNLEPSQEEESDTDTSDDSLPDPQTVSDTEEEEPPADWDPDDQEIEEEVILAPPEEFEDIYEFPIPDAEEKLYELWIEKACQGKPAQLGGAEI
ncbi:hypothetical protein C0992_006572 [Termitomyces sp. T32_za158]|nr:hypothetical protein C0992_006572 [Termitomyces sp. T32_za158]